MSLPINISASRGAAILTYYDKSLEAIRPMSKWSTPVSVWLQIMEARNHGFCEKNNYELPVIEDNPSMRWGRAFESAIIELAESKVDNDKIEEREKSYEADDEYITCHIDGRYRHRYCLHEGKTTTAYYFSDNFGEPGTDQVPIEYQIQCQHQMICTGAEKVILSVLVFPKRPEEWEEVGYIPMQINNGVWRISRPDGNLFDPSEWAYTLSEMGFFHQYEIIANPELQKLMIEKYSQFWNNNILTGIPPEPCHYDDIRALVREPVGTIIADEHVERMMAEYKNITEEIGQGGSLRKRANQIKIEALQYMRNTEKTIDDESDKKWILRGIDGKKIATYGKNKSGEMYFR
jgi:predicted phage-related endonuclease